MYVNKLHLRLVLLIAVSGISGSLASAQAGNERESILHALSLSYGPPTDITHPRFKISADHFLVPTFSGDGVLTEISIDPKSVKDPTQTFGLPRPDFEAVLANLESIKPMGAPEPDNGGRERSAWRIHATLVYENAYLRTAELMGYGKPDPIESAQIYYIRPVSGLPRIARDEKPDDGSRYRLICFDDAHYLARESEFLKLWSKPSEQQTVELAGPTDDGCSPDEELYKRAIAAINEGRLDVACISLRTLINTYPDSEYAKDSKTLLANPQMSKCGEGWSDPRNCNKQTTLPVER